MEGMLRFSRFGSPFVNSKLTTSELNSKSTSEVRTKCDMYKYLLLTTENSDGNTMMSNIRTLSKTRYIYITAAQGKNRHRLPETQANNILIWKKHSVCVEVEATRPGAEYAPCSIRQPVYLEQSIQVCGATVGAD
jgi:hypothetical protein